MIYFKPALKAVACSIALLSVGAHAASETKSPIQLSDMGSFMFAGSVKKASDGETFHGDHGYAQYFIPVHNHSLPVVMWHGGGQSGKSWESTPDGRDGFWQIFTRAGWPVFIIDQPRRGRAGRTYVADSHSQIPTDNKESMAWNTFRLGTWIPPGKPQAFKNTEFPQNPYSLEQFMRWPPPSRQPDGCGLSWPVITVIKTGNIIVFQVVIWPVQLNLANKNPADNLPAQPPVAMAGGPLRRGNR